MRESDATRISIVRVPDGLPDDEAQRMMRAGGALLVLTVLLLLPVAAFASPTDPTWVSGIYDAADGDDEVSVNSGKTLHVTVQESEQLARQGFDSPFVVQVARELLRAGLYVASGGLCHAIHEAG